MGSASEKLEAPNASPSFNIVAQYQRQKQISDSSEKEAQMTAARRRWNRTDDRRKPLRADLPPNQINEGQMPSIIEK